MRLSKHQPPADSFDINPDEIFLDASNLPEFDRHQFEGRLEKPLGRRAALGVGIFCFVVGILFVGRLWNLQVARGAQFSQQAAQNSLHPSLVFGPRGVIFDRNGTLLAWNDNTVSVASSTDSSTTPSDPNLISSGVLRRVYATSTGLDALLGYVKYPTKDQNGFYYQQDYIGVDGVEKYYNDQLTGTNGSELSETNAAGQVISSNVIVPPQPGQNITLSIDSRVQSQLYADIQNIAGQIDSPGGAGIIMNVHTGEVLADVTYPEYSSQIMTDGTNASIINGYLNDPAHPLLDRVTTGLYAPGSIVKPVLAMGALDSGVVSASTVIHTTGSISVKNPYDPSITYTFNDWRDNGDLDMVHAIAESSDAYFYIVGGGYQGQKGMGIDNIDKYANLFGYGQAIPAGYFVGPAGTVPSPAWKASTFNGAAWTIGDTYHSAIGQFGWQATPAQVVRAIAAIANNGTLLTPTVLLGDTSNMSTVEHIDLPQSYFDTIHQGMRLSAEVGTGDDLNVPYMQFATKTGTAQLGPNNEYSNTWVAGFWPYDNPEYAFAVVMERRPLKYTLGAQNVARALFDWMDANTPEYFNGTSTSQQ